MAGCVAYSPPSIVGHSDGTKTRSCALGIRLSDLTDDGPNAHWQGLIADRAAYYECVDRHYLAIDFVLVGFAELRQVRRASS